jgi:hypothetical protein
MLDRRTLEVSLARAEFKAQSYAAAMLTEGRKIKELMRENKVLAEKMANFKRVAEKNFRTVIDAKKLLARYKADRKHQSAQILSSREALKRVEAVAKTRQQELKVAQRKLLRLKKSVENRNRIIEEANLKLQELEVEKSGTESTVAELRRVDPSSSSMMPSMSEETPEDVGPSFPKVGSEASNGTIAATKVPDAFITMQHNEDDDTGTQTHWEAEKLRLVDRINELESAFRKAEVQREAALTAKKLYEGFWKDAKESLIRLQSGSSVPVPQSSNKKIELGKSFSSVWGHLIETLRSSPALITGSLDEKDKSSHLKPRQSDEPPSDPGFAKRPTTTHEGCSLRAPDTRARDAKLTGSENAHETHVSVEVLSGDDLSLWAKDASTKETKAIFDDRISTDPGPMLRATGAATSQGLPSRVAAGTAIQRASNDSQKAPTVDMDPWTSNAISMWAEHTREIEAKNDFFSDSAVENLGSWEAPSFQSTNSGEESVAVPPNANDNQSRPMRQNSGEQSAGRANSARKLTNTEDIASQRVRHNSAKKLGVPESEPNSSNEAGNSAHRRSSATRDAGVPMSRISSSAESASLANRRSSSKQRGQATTRANPTEKAKPTKKRFRSKGAVGEAGTLPSSSDGSLPLPPIVEDTETASKAIKNSKQSEFPQNRCSRGNLLTAEIKNGGESKDSKDDTKGRHASHVTRRPSSNPQGIRRPSQKSRSSPPGSGHQSTCHSGSGRRPSSRSKPISKSSLRDLIPVPVQVKRISSRRVRRTSYRASRVQVSTTKYVLGDRIPRTSLP